MLPPNAIGFVGMCVCVCGVGGMDVEKRRDLYRPLSAGNLKPDEETSPRRKMEPEELDERNVIKKQQEKPYAICQSARINHSVVSESLFRPFPTPSAGAWFLFERVACVFFFRWHTPLLC